MNHFGVMYSNDDTPLAVGTLAEYVGACRHHHKRLVSALHGCAEFIRKNSPNVDLSQVDQILAEYVDTFQSE